MQVRKLVATGCMLLFVGCAGSQSLSGSEAKAQVQQLLVLYKENRAKFVLQKQDLIQADSCSRASALREAVVEMEKEANMSPENTSDITQLRMELAEAEKLCLEK